MAEAPRTAPSQDPEVVAAKAAADKAHTDLEKRERLRAYYKVYYTHMQALASTPELKAYLEGKKKAMLAGLAQPRCPPRPNGPGEPFAAMISAA